MSCWLTDHFYSARPLEARLQPNIGFTLRRVLRFTRVRL